MKQWIIPLIILGLLAYYFRGFIADIWVQPENIYFDRANPQSFQIWLSREPEYFDVVTLKITDIGGDTYGECGCVKRISGWRGYDVCQNAGYRDVAIDPSGQCDRGVTSCPSDSYICFKTYTATPDWIELSIDGRNIYRWEKIGAQPMETNNFADIVNVKCRSAIEARKICEAGGDCDAKTMECVISVVAKASHNYGKIKIVPGQHIQRVEIPTTTTTVPTTTTIPVIPPKNIFELILQKIQNFIQSILNFFRR